MKYKGRRENTNDFNVYGRIPLHDRRRGDLRQRVALEESAEDEGALGLAEAQVGGDEGRHHGDPGAHSFDDDDVGALQGVHHQPGVRKDQGEGVRIWSTVCLQGSPTRLQLGEGGRTRSA